jgi:phosphohistidine phosphatase
MDLIVWRHAEAEELTADAFSFEADLTRSLTARGEKQAARMATWLDRQLPEGARIMSSPARRCEQTVLALGRKYRLRDELAPGATAAQLLEVANWPQSKSPVLVIGHQPTLGQTIAQLMGLKEADCPVRKGALWWLRSRVRDGQCQTVVVTVQSPDVL